ncbi:hypothetical protein BBJ28_00022702 [Nothophytophthora sp. Chile5]|nr:hypothetical protein BBJ28_00022702 [Nothophytophthora sp. Chile5]
MATRIPIAFRRGPRTKKKAIDLIKTWHIYRGDKLNERSSCFNQVEVINGPHKGKQGEVVSVVRDLNKVIVENINMVRSPSHRYVKSTPVAAGRSYLSPSPIHYSNVNLVDPSIGKPTRVAIRFTDEGEKVRVSKKTGTIIPKPAVLKERHHPRRKGAPRFHSLSLFRLIAWFVSRLAFILADEMNLVVLRPIETGVFDTAPEDVLERTVEDWEVTRV